MHRLGGDLTAEHLEKLPDEAVGCPVRHADAPTGPADACELRGRSGVVGREHHPKAGQHGVETGVLEWQGLGVGLPEFDVQPFGQSPGCPALQQAADIVCRCDVAAAPGRGETGVAIAGRDVQHPLIPADVAGLGELLANQLERGADHGVVAAGPGNLLAGLEGGKVDGGGHGVSPVG